MHLQQTLLGLRPRSGSERGRGRALAWRRRPLLLQRTTKTTVSSPGNPASASSDSD